MGGKTAWHKTVLAADHMSHKNQDFDTFVSLGLFITVPMPVP